MAFSDTALANLIIQADKSAPKNFVKIATSATDVAIFL
ncbi:hypothetical protein HPSSW114_1969 [Glaesserella parasuis SW114]|nr:hypothetical protein HPSSW114_1969 [Glaesserella parasuis SW114]